MNRIVAATLLGAGLVLGSVGCGNVDDRTEAPTVADVQQQALAQQPPPGGPRYTPLPAPEKPPFSPDPEYHGVNPPADAFELQPEQDPVPSALSRIQEIAATTADMSNRFDEARDHFRKADPFLELLDGEVDGDTWDELQAGFGDMHDALDDAAANSNHGGDAGKLEKFRAAMADAELASGRIALAVVYALDHYYDD